MREPWSERGPKRVCEGLVWSMYQLVQCMVEDFLGCTILAQSGFKE